MPRMFLLGAFVVTAGALLTTVPLSSAQGSAAKPIRSIEDGVLDEIKLFVEKPPITSVVIRPFSATDADIVNGEKKEETKTMQAKAPRLLADKFVAKLKSLGTFTDVTVAEGTAAPAGALVVQGRFNELDPGSRAKRYFAGFGAGKSAVGVDGTVVGPDGSVLASFAQRRIGAMGAFGGDSIGKLTDDSGSIGEDIAAFLNAWASGKKLK